MGVVCGGGVGSAAVRWSGWGWWAPGWGEGDGERVRGEGEVGRSRWGRSRGGGAGVVKLGVRRRVVVSAHRPAGLAMVTIEVGLANPPQSAPSHPKSYPNIGRSTYSPTTPNPVESLPSGVLPPRHLHNLPSLIPAPPREPRGD